MVSDGGQLDLDGIKARAEAATPGPWRADDSTVRTPDHRALAYEVLLGNGDTRDGYPQCLADVAFVAAARSDVPTLVAEVERLTQERDEARRIIRNAHQAIRTNTTAAAVALAMFDTGDAGTPSLLDENARLTQERDEARERANEAARLSADARDRADDLAKTIEQLREQVAIVEDDRTAVDAWVVNVAMEHGLPDDPATHLDTIARYLREEVAARKDLSHYATILERDRSDRDKWTIDLAKRHGLNKDIDDPWAAVHALNDRIAAELDQVTAERNRLTQENTRLQNENARFLLDLATLEAIKDRALDVANVERDVIEKAKAWRARLPGQPLDTLPSNHFAAEEIALAAAVDALTQPEEPDSGP